MSASTTSSVTASSTVTARLAALGLTLPPVPAAVAAYVPAVRQGELVWTSGQLPFVDSVLPASGLVGEGDGLVTPQDAARLAGLCALNALAAAAALVDLDRLRIVKVVGFVASAPGFTGQATVVDGASSLLGDVFGDAGRHARSAVGVAALPLGAPVEIELTAALV
jgi:enamine deaminase RidA (YjgF/YER057c/UK114 family)